MHQLHAAEPDTCVWSSYVQVTVLVEAFLIEELDKVLEELERQLEQP